MKSQITLILIVLFTFLTFYSKAQTTVEFETGLVKLTSGVKMNDYDESHLTIRNIQSTSGSNFVGGNLLLINKQTLNVDDTLFTWDFTSSDFKGGFVDFYTDTNGKKYYVELGSTSNEKELILNYYQMANDYTLGNLLVSKRWPNKYSQQIGFVNNELIIIYSNHSFVTDSLYIETYDTLGVMQQARMYDAYSQQTNQVSLIGHQFLGIKKHPNLPKAFVLASMISTKIFVVDQTSLDTVITYDAAWFGAFPANSNLTNSYGYSLLVNRQFRVEDDGIVLTGTVLTLPYYLSNHDVDTEDYQFFRLKQYWDRTYEARDFGSKDITNGGCFGYDINERTHTHVIAGSVPWNTTFLSNEKREIVIYLYDQWGKYDSIYIHGDKNHVCSDLFVEDNGDIFISGMYSDAWSTDSVYNWLTKIPGIAVGMIEQEKINNHLFLFPNPTVERIQIKEVSKFLNGEFEIYSQTGVLVKQGEVTGQEIDVSSFIAGVYILTVKSESGEQFNAIFVKE